jgi:hypothetical protein
MERLDNNLLRAVLARLPAKDLAAARQVSRAFDAAARAVAKGITLTPDNTRNADGRVRLSRFPALAELRLQDWTTAAGTSIVPPGHHAAFSAHATLLHSCFLEGRRLDSVTRLVLDSSTLDAGTLALVLSHLPGLKSISLTSAAAKDTLIPPMVLHTPELEVLVAPSIKIKDASASAALARLTKLDHLQIHEVATADAWAALPVGQLTSLAMSQMPPPPALEDLGLGRLIELRNIELPFNSLEALARGAPHLTLLVFHPRDDWAGNQPPAAAAFRNVTHASLHCNKLPNIITVHVPILFPALQRCMIDGEHLELVWTGLKQLESLGFFDADILPRLDWDALASVTSLTALGCITKASTATREVYPQIQRLTQLQVLDLILWAGHPSAKINATPVLEMAASLPIHTLSIACERHWNPITQKIEGTITIDSAALFKFVRSSPSLRTLSFGGMHAFGFGDASLLAMHPSLQRLQVACDEGDREQVEWMGRQGRARGGPEVEVVGVLKPGGICDFQHMGAWSSASL